MATKKVLEDEINDLKQQLDDKLLIIDNYERVIHIIQLTLKEI